MYLTPGAAVALRQASVTLRSQSALTEELSGRLIRSAIRYRLRNGRVCPRGGKLCRNDVICYLLDIFCPSEF